jgi:hypothetical protein
MNIVTNIEGEKPLCETCFPLFSNDKPKKKSKPNKKKKFIIINDSEDDEEDEWIDKAKTDFNKFKYKKEKIFTKKTWTGEWKYKNAVLVITNSCATEEEEKLCTISDYDLDGTVKFRQWKNNWKLVSNSCDEEKHFYIWANLRDQMLDCGEFEDSCCECWAFFDCECKCDCHSEIEESDEEEEEDPYEKCDICSNPATAGLINDVFICIECREEEL